MLDIDDIYDELDFINQAAVSEQIEASATALSSQTSAAESGEQQFNAQAYKDSLLEKLNDRQAQAVGMEHASALVLAGAGSGKTSVLTARVAYLLADGIDPSQVMTVTFTNKASQEMRNRLNRILPRNEASDLWMGTFHSLCNRMLRECHKEAGLPKNFAILDTDGQEVMLKTIMRDAGLLPTKAERESAKAASVLPDLLTADPLGGMGGEKPETAATPTGAADAGDDDEEDDRRMKPSEVVSWINGKKERNIKPDEIEPLSPEDETRIQLYRTYQQSCSDQGLLDFSDLLHRCVELLEKDPMVRNRYRGKFKAILVDEFQDTNDVQYRWIQLLKSERAFVMAVGDDDQSIYAFRGANPENMKRFVDEMTVTADHPQGRVIKLEQNYRSLPYILDAANAVIDKNSNRLGKSLWSGKPDQGERILATEYENGFTEAQTVATRIHHLVRTQGVPPNEIAVLYRTNTQSRLLEQELNKLSIPVTVYGGFRFYERQEVKNVLAYMDLVCSFERDISLSRVVNFPPRGIGERTIEDLRQESKENNVSMMEMIGRREANGTVTGAVALRKQAQLVEFATMMIGLAEVAQTCKLSELVEAVIEQSGIRKFYEEGGTAKKKAKAGGKGSQAPKSEEEERLGNIAELVSAAAQFEQDNPHLTTAAELLPEYLSFVQLMTSTSAADMDKKATVSLMTVHSSKGLEFDHVFITGMEEGIFPHARSIKEDEANGHGSNAADDAWVESMLDNDELKASRDEFIGSGVEEIDGPGIQEERRLMYVAMTRARKELQISHAKVRMLGKEEKETERSRFVLEIPKARIEFKKERDQSMNDTWQEKQGCANKPSFVLGSSSRASGQSNQGFKGFGRGAPNSGAREYGGDAFDETRPAFVPRETKTVRSASTQGQSRGPENAIHASQPAAPVAHRTQMPAPAPAPASATDKPAAQPGAAPGTANQAAVKTTWMKRRLPTPLQATVKPSVPSCAPAAPPAPPVASTAPARENNSEAVPPSLLQRRRVMR